MITRFALFEGQINTGETDAFRAAILKEVLPHWKSFPGVIAVRVCFANERDEGAAELPLILTISYPNRKAVDVALASPERALAKAATEAVLARFFRGRIHHHITEANDYETSQTGNTRTRVALESPDQPEVIALIADLDAYQDTLYPAEARYALDLAALKQSNVLFAIARDSDNVAIGCGAVVVSEKNGELKRMYVRPENRSQGVAQQILRELEASAIQRGCQNLFLETGPYQHEALAFYGKQGYKQTGPFGDYPEHPLSVFMSKALARMISHETCF
jgi:putative acetyltransferase